MRTTGRMDPSTVVLLRAYLDAVGLVEPLQARVWATAQLTLTQARILRRLDKEDKALGELGAELGLAAPSVTRLIDRLELRGLIVRGRDGTDRRRIVASIRPAGRKLLASAPLLQGSAIHIAVKRLAPADRERIAAALKQLTSAIRAVEGELDAGAQAPELGMARSTAAGANV